MKRLLFCLLFLVGVCFAQGSGYNSYQSGIFSTTGSGAGVRQNTTMLYHQISWVKTGTVSSCTVAVDSSPDGITWTAGGIIAGQTCTSNGTSTVAAGNAVYIRVTFTALSGGGTVQYFYKGWSYSPTGSSTLPSIASYQLWVASGLTAPSLATSTSGGSLPAGYQIYVQYSLVNLVGETVPSYKVFISTGAGSSNSVTVTAPTIYSGYTGYTVYSCQTNLGSPCATQQQAASGNCVNITTNCVIQVAGAGSSALTVSTASTNPPNLQATECPGGVIPYTFVQTSDGNYHTQAGMDMTSVNGNIGVFTDCRKHWFVDSSTDPVSFNNAFVVVNHLAGVNTSLSVQDRAFSAYMYNGTTDSSTHYSMAAIQAEVDYQGTANINGAPDGEASAGSFQLGYFNTAGNSCGGIGCSAVRANSFLEVGSTQPTAGINAIIARTQINSGSGPNTTNFAVRGQCFAGTTGYVHGCVDFAADTPATVGTGSRLLSYNYGYLANNWGTDYRDWSYVANCNSPCDPSQGRNWFPNNFVFNFTSIGGTIGVNGSLNTQSLTTSQVTGTVGTPSVSQVGTPGVTSYTYVIVPRDAYGGAALKSSNANTTTGNATLNGSNYNQITISQTVQGNVIGVVSFDVYRTVSGGTPSSIGKIGSISVGALGTPPLNATNTYYGTILTFNDTGLAGDGTSPPSTNTTGGISAQIVTAAKNTVRVSGDFTSAANTNLQTITGLSWTLSPNTQNYSFHCGLMYSQGTAAASMQFGIQVATIAPTSVNVKARVDTSASAVASGILNSLTTTTATAIITFTPSTFGTVFGADLDGTFELPGGENTVNIMVQTSNSSDLPTIKRGSYCSILP